ncbi:hypothetical protein BHE74_00033153 [Ensete ventricosum]|nr:hypothetical protein BHE74_00033153 [Ensete ventricosum]
MVVNNRSSRWFIDFRDRPVHVNRTPFLSRKVSLLFFPFGEGLLHPWIDGDCPELAAKVLNLTSRPRLLLAAVGVGFLDGRHFVAVRRRSRHRCCFALKRRQENISFFGWLWKRSAVSNLTARYGRYIPIRQQTSTRTAHYRANLAPYRTIRGCFRPVTTRNKSVTIDFDRRQPTGWYQPGYGLAIARLTAAREEEARKKKEKEGEEEEEPRIAPPSNGKTASRLLLRRILRQRSKTSTAGEPRDDTADEENLARRRLLRSGLLLFAFSSSEATRKRGGSLGDVRKEDIIFHLHGHLPPSAALIGKSKGRGMSGGGHGVWGPMAVGQSPVFFGPKWNRWIREFA